MINKNIDYKEDYLYPVNIHLNLTDDCNLRCKYCFVHHKPNYMPLEVALKAVDWLYENYLYHKEHNTLLTYTNNGQCNIQFFGGEPMLCYESVIKPVVKYCNEKYPFAFHYGITTNGTLLNKERIDFLKENNFSILYSIDGPPEVQNYSRPCKDPNIKSFDLMAKNLPYLLKQFPYLPFRQTINIDTVDHLYDGYKYAEQLGFKHWIYVIDKIHPQGWTDEKKEILRDQINHIYYHRIIQLQNNILPMQTPRMDLSLWNAIQTLLAAADETGEYESSLTPRICGVGLMSESIAYNGDIFTCQEQVTWDNNNIFKVGNIFENKIEIQKQKNIFERFIKELKEIDLSDNKQCQNCPLRLFCEGSVYCPSTSYMLHGKLAYPPEDIDCFEKQVHYQNIMLMLQLLLGQDNEAIHKFLTNQQIL